MAQYEWILGEPAETYIVYEWIQGEPFVQYDNTAVAGIPMLLEGNLINSPLLNGRLIGLCLILVILI